MKYKELSGGLFTDIFAVKYPSEYEQIFGDTPSEVVDGYSLLKYGERELVSAMNETNKDIIASSIISINLHTWIKQASVLRAEYDVLNPIIREIESTENSNREEEKTDDTVHSNKYFNDVDYEDGRKENRANQTGWQEQKTSTSIERGNSGSKSVSEVITEEIALRELNIKEKVIKDLINDLTLSIYK